VVHRRRRRRGPGGGKLTTIRDARILAAGDTALVVEFGAGIDARLNARVLALAARLGEARIAGVAEIVPTFRSLMVHYDPLVVAPAELTAQVERLLDALPAAAPPGRAWRLPACYDPSLAPDLEEVAARTGLTAAQVVGGHSAPAYHVYMLGFLPGQAYLGDVAPELALPRRASPRPRIPAGSLAVAMRMTCIFPLQTPCGWHLIGRSPAPLWCGSAGPLLRPGDRVSFTPISLREFETLHAQAARGELRLQPEESLEAAA
jgi:KipI family sensor histidine kinase inhibitor